jgi:hypothetical protein
MLRCFFFSLILVASVAAPAPAAAEPDDVYQLDLRIDIPVVALSAAISLGALLKRSELPACAPSCNSAALNFLDRPVIHYHSHASSVAADIMVTLMLTVPVILDAFDARFQPWMKDVFIMGEALFATQAVAQLTKFSVERYSPVLYSGDPNRLALHDFDATRSFYSAHAASAAAVTTAFTMTYWLRHPHDPWRFVVLVAGAALSFATGAFKVAAGEHFWTDVIAGSVAGAATGVLVPVLHIASD